MDRPAFSHCNVNCGCHCVLKWRMGENNKPILDAHFEDGKPYPARPCHLGQSMQRWIEHPNRLVQPLRRTGPRGSGSFEAISWDKAIDTIVEKLDYTIKTWGNSSIYLAYGTGVYSATGNPSKRLLNCLGGFLDHVYDYSTNMVQGALPYLFGASYSPYNNIYASSFSEAEAHSDLLIMFGSNPKATRMGGAGCGQSFAQTRQSILNRGGKVVQIDYRLNETCKATPQDWLPIRSGTDAALACALIHEFIVDNACDLDFLHTYCVGFDEESMPPQARGKNLSLSSYIMGTGYDRIEKTCAWASEITGIPAQRIRELATSLEQAQAPFIMQGWGVQRHANGEDTCRAICAIPLVLGKVGLPGTNTGTREADPSIALVPSLPASDLDEEQGAPQNAITYRIPCYTWIDAVEHGRNMTANNAGIYDPYNVLAGNGLPSNIHFIWNYAGNCLTNQHGNINHVHDVLSRIPDQELFILAWDTVLTDSARYADIILPDAMRSEQLSMYKQGGGEWEARVVVGGPVQSPRAETRSSYDVMADIAERFGVHEQFRRGRTHDEWVHVLYESGRSVYNDMPSWDTILEQGIYRTEIPPAIGLEAFRADPIRFKLDTPSGKIELYSQALADAAATWELAPHQHISPIPCYTPDNLFSNHEKALYPLLCSGFHGTGRIHSSFGFLEGLANTPARSAWIHPSDAQARGIETGDVVVISSPYGSIHIEAFVTERIVQGVIALPQGAWHKADMEGDRIDYGGCINTLTGYHPTPIAKGNGDANSIIVEVTRFA